jgi:hypothetical protein
MTMKRAMNCLVLKKKAINNLLFRNKQNYFIWASLLYPSIAGDVVVRVAMHCRPLDIRSLLDHPWGELIAYLPKTTLIFFQKIKLWSHQCFQNRWRCNCFISSVKNNLLAVNVVEDCCRRKDPFANVGVDCQFFWAPFNRLCWWVKVPRPVKERCLAAQTKDCRSILSGKNAYLRMYLWTRMAADSCNSCSPRCHHGDSPPPRIFLKLHIGAYFVQPHILVYCSEPRRVHARNSKSPADLDGMLTPEEIDSDVETGELAAGLGAVMIKLGMSCLLGRPPAPWGGKSAAATMAARSSRPGEVALGFHDTLTMRSGRSDETSCID